MTVVPLSEVLPGAPDVPIAQCYSAGHVIACKARGAAKNVIHFHCCVPAFAFETDPYFPPEGQHCDWCVVASQNLGAHFVELKGSDLKEALTQLTSTISFLSGRWGLQPQKAYVVISGQHPRIPKAGRPYLHQQFKKECHVNFIECSAGATLTLN